MTGKNKTGNNKAEPQWRSRLFVFIPAVALCAFLLVAVIHYVVSSSQAAESVQPDLSGWEMALADGSPIAPDPAGGLDLPEGAILYLTADAPAFASGQAVASVRSKGVLYAFLVDGRPPTPSDFWAEAAAPRPCRAGSIPSAAARAPG